MHWIFILFCENLNNNNLTIQKDLKCMLSQVNMRAVGGGIPELTWRDAVRLIVTLAFFIVLLPDRFKAPASFTFPCVRRV